MKELQLQDKYLIHFFCERSDWLWYTEHPASTVSKLLFLEDDLITFLSETTLNRDNYRELLRKFKWDEKKLVDKLCEFLNDRIKDSTNMAIFINNNKTFTFKWLKFVTINREKNHFKYEMLF